MLTDLIVVFGRAAQRLSDGKEESARLAYYVLATADLEFQRTPLWSFMPLEPDWRKRTGQLPNSWLTKHVLGYEAQKQEQLVCWAWNELRLALDKSSFDLQEQEVRADMASSQGVNQGSRS